MMRHPNYSQFPFVDSDGPLNRGTSLAPLLSGIEEICPTCRKKRIILAGPICWLCESSQLKNSQQCIACHRKSNCLFGAGLCKSCMFSTDLN